MDDAESAFWAEHARAGGLVTLAVVVVNLVYALATWSSGAYRPALVTLNALALVGAGIALVLVPEERIARSPHRDVIFAAWILTSALLVAVATHLDGGIDSPFAWLFPLSVMMVAVVHRPRLVVFTAGASMTGLLVVAGLNGGIDAAVLVRAAYLVVIGYLSAVAARTRWHQYQDQVERNAALSSMAAHDGLTGLLNHRAFHLRLTDEVARAQRSGAPLSLVLVDLDHFKTINDQHGHLVGDDVLRRIAGALVDVARETDVVARIGGEEFCMLLPDTAPEVAAVPAERLRETVEAMCDPEPVTISVGVSGFPADATTPTELFSAADHALYRAKRAGRNRVHTARAA
ncbi:MAG TPA: GGDEF domain-containing protein [Acidimicrobiia bacterium]|nr:GGDEF domain-containing protein [Acidimicrobiia bacterium]